MNIPGDNSTCGKWRPAPPPSMPQAAAPAWRYVTPWAMETPSQFRLPPPPNYLNSSIYQQAYVEGVWQVLVCRGT